MNRANVLLAVVTFCLFVTGCSLFRPEIQLVQQPAPLFDGMSDYHREVTTSSEKAQRYIDQGLVWAFAFNHDEAIRSFREATKLDPECAMAWWGIALCNGPHINNPTLPPKRARDAWRALEKAVALKDQASPMERALIEALAERYEAKPSEDRAHLDQAYADAMGEVWSRYGDDADVGTLYAEAMMDLRPWDLWKDDGQPQPGTETILAVLEKTLRLDPDHPGANHLYIHAVEASPNPERALASADRLRDLVPISGHLRHMPSHIDVLVGDWENACKQNELALAADRAYEAKSPKQGFYRLYMAHNHHMLAFAGMMSGRSATAIEAARAVVENVPEGYLKQEAALMDPFMGAHYDALKRFGHWDEIIALSAPPSYLPITTAHWRFHRALAYAAKGDVAKAEKERELFRKAAKNVPEDAVMAINPAHRVLAIAEHMLNGEIAYRRGDMNESINELRKAIEIEDNLQYMEPPEWVQPVRHTLGAVLVSDGQFAEAEQVYRRDLKKWPQNGWSLFGLSRALRAQGKIEEASQVASRFRDTWKHADIEIGTSCLCVR